MRAVVSLAPATLEIEPGSDATITVTISNTTSVVERYDVEVVGELATWAKVEPPFLKLDKAPEPGSPREEVERERATGQVRVTFRIPRASEPRAGTYPIGVFAKATATADASKTTEGSVTIRPFVALEPAIVPQTSRSAISGRHDLTVRNLGNTVAQVTTSASQVDLLLDFTVFPDMVGILPGDSKAVRIRAKPKDKAWTGPPTDIPFVVKTEEPMGGTTTTAAFLRQLAIIPSWIRPLAGLVAAAAALIVLGPPILRAIGVLPSPSQAAIESPVVTATPFVATPQPNPTPTPFVPSPSPCVNCPVDRFAAAGDLEAPGIADGTGLVLDCQRGEQPCRSEARALLLDVLKNLQGNADGVLMRDFDDLPPGTLPILGEWAGGIYQFQSAAGSGETNLVRLDLAPVLAGYPGYVVLQDTLRNNEIRRFVLPAGDGKLLFDTLYLYTAPGDPLPTPQASYSIDIGYADLREITFGRAWVFTTPWIVPTPAP